MQYHWHCGFGVKWLITSRFGDFIYVRETFDTSTFVECILNMHWMEDVTTWILMAGTIGTVNMNHGHV